MMSKETYVGGDIIETTGGNNLSYAKDIIENIASQVIQDGKTNGTFYGINRFAPMMEIDLINVFKGRAIFKLINPLPTFVAQNYNKSTKTFSNINRQYLPYGFDWYRDDWETLVNAEIEIENLKISDFTKILSSGHSASDPKPLYNVISPNPVKANYKIVHRIIDGVEKLIEYSIWIKISGTASIASSDIFYDDPSASLLPIAGQPQIHQFEELNLVTGSRTGVIYKSDDADLTNFNQIKNTLGSFGSLKTMKLLSSLQEMKKEYSPTYSYTSIREQGSLKTVINSIKTIMKINGKEYLVPWIALFNTTENEVMLDIILDGDHSATGKIKVVTLIEDVDKIALTGDIETSISVSNKGTMLSKKINIKFNKPIDKHSIIEVRFFDDAKVSIAGYIGEIIGLLNVYKNDIEYQLDVQYVDVKFKGNIDNLPFADPTIEKATLNFNRNSLVATDLTTSIVKPAYSINSIMTSTDLKNYVTSNINLFKNTLNQSVIKPNILPTPKDIEIDFGAYNFNSPPTTTLGIDKIKKSINNYSYYDIITLQMDSDLFIRGFIDIYEAKYGNLDRGILIFYIPFSIVEPRGSEYSIFKGRVDKVEYDSKYLILARTLLEENAKEVPAHEVAHSLGLHHTFVEFTENSNKHHFAKSETLNVMDYSTTTISYNLWQWKIMQNDLKLTMAQ